MKRTRMVTVVAAACMALAAPAASAVAAAAPAQASVLAATRPGASDAAGLSSCVYGAGDTKTCGYIENGGSGNYVTFMNADGCPMGSGEWIHEEITGPGIANINSTTVYRSHGNCQAVGTNIFWYVDVGYYYFTTWRLNTNGTYTQVGQVALYVN